MIKSILSLVLSLVSIHVFLAQNSVYDVKVLKVDQFELNKYNLDLPAQVNFKGLIDFEGIELSNNEKNYKQGDFFVYGGLNICDKYGFLFSNEYFSTKRKNDSLGEKGWLIVNTKQPYGILIHNVFNELSLSAYLYENTLFIIKTIDSNYDLVGDDINDIYINYFVVIEFQNDGSYIVLQENEARVLVKQYKVPLD